MALGKGNTFANDILDLILNAVAIADLAENDGSSPAANLYISLHTASPEAGNQSTNEVAYTGYARVAVARQAVDPKWTVSAAAAENAEAITFGEDTVGDNVVVTHFGVGVGSSGATKLLYCGTCSLIINPGIVPSFAAGALDITED